MANQGAGLSEAQMRECDAFVYIPQYGCGTASLNVTVAASVVLHHFALWAGYPERSREGGKFDVAQRPLRTVPRGKWNKSKSPFADGKGEEISFAGWVRGRLQITWRRIVD